MFTIMGEHQEIPDEALPLSGGLRVAIGRIARRIKQLYEEGEETFSEASVLSRLERAGPATPGALAVAEHVRPQATAATVNALERRGLVTRAPDSSDGRKVIVSITEAGQHALRDKGLVITQHMSDVLMEQFSPAEQQQLREALPLLERFAELL